MSITLKAARINAGYTQLQVGKYLEVSDLTIRNWESGKSLPDALQLQKITQLYNVKFEDLIFLRSRND